MGNSLSNRVDRYSKAIDRLRSGAQSRASRSGQSFTEMMVAEQVALRAPSVSKSTFYVESAAAKAWLQDATDLDDEQRVAALEFLSKGRDALCEWGRESLSKIVTSAVKMGDMRSPEEISFDVCGLSTMPGVRSKSGAKVQAISHHDIDRLTQEMINVDPIANLISRLRKAKVESSYALSAILLHCCWLTGMRPVEMFACALVIVRKDEVAMEPDLIDREIPDITDRSYTGLNGLLAVGGAIQDLEKSVGGKVKLAIRNAKTTNANPETVQEYRLLSLANIDPYKLGVIWLTTQLRRLPITSREVEDIRDLASRHARTASRKIMPERGPVSLYSMRHDFSDRAKRRFTKPQVAALMGHTGKNSGAHYGTKSIRRQSGNGPAIGKMSQAGWLPQPDEQQSERLLAKWNPSLAAKPEVIMTVEEFVPMEIVATIPEPEAAPPPSTQASPAQPEASQDTDFDL